MNAHTNPTAISLDDRIAAALANGETPSADLEKLAGEATLAVEQAVRVFAAARLEALDPTTPRASVAAARTKMSDAEFDADRLKSALMALERAREEAVKREHQDKLRSEWELAKAERDALVEVIKAECPALIDRLTKIFADIVANEQHLAEINRRSGGPYLESAEFLARGGKDAYPVSSANRGIHAGYVPKLTDARLAAFAPRYGSWAWNRKANY
jgi:hypothetical protein